MLFGMVGASYTARSTAIAGEECINFYPETRETSGGVSPAREYGGAAAGGNKSLLWTPGLNVFCQLPESPVRASHWIGSRLFAIGGTQLCEVSSAGVATYLATVANDGNSASIASNGLQLLVVSGGRAYCYTLATGAMLEVTSQLAAIPLKVVYCDSYFVVMFQNSNKYQVSDILDGTSWPGTYVNAVSVFPEGITSIAVNHRELWVFGARHTQPYQDTGSAEVFDVIPGAFIETGNIAPFAPCNLDNAMFWISEDERGGRMAWRSNGYTPMRISTHAVEIDLNSYPSLLGMTTYAYQDGGHLFWVLYIPGSSFSWVYDVSESLWHKRAAWINGAWGAHRSWNHVYAFGQHLVGDWSTGNLYSLSLNNFTDNGSLIRRVRRTPIFINEMEFIQHRELNLDFEMGNLTTVAPTDQPALASSLYGPSAGGSAVDTSLAGVAWTSPVNVMRNDGTYASAALNAVVGNSVSSVSVGTSEGGGVAWSNPGNIDSVSVFAGVSLAAGGPPVIPSYPSGGVNNAANPSNQHPTDTYLTLSGFASTAATSATVYVVANGTISASQGGGVLTLSYSTDSGATWTVATSTNASFTSTSVPITISGITNLSTIQVKLTASCSCAPSGFSNVNVAISSWYAIIAGSGQPTAQTLVAAVSGLTIPAGMTILGVGVSFNADYSGVAPTFQVGLNVGNVDPTFTLTTTPAIYTAGGSGALWGYNAWTADTLANLKVNFFASSTGSTGVAVNSLVVTAYYVPTQVLSDAIDVTQFGFTVPATATPKGIVASLVAYASVDGATVTVQPLNAGSPVGASQTLPLPTSPTALTFGTINSLFGATWNDSDLSSAGFGLRITAKTTGGISAHVFVGRTTLQLYAPSTVFAPNYVGPDPVLVDGNGNPRPPQAMVRWSDDRAKTWSNEHVVNLGFAGQTKVRSILRRLGRGRYRIYEVSVSDPVPWVLVDGYLRAE